MIDNQYRKVLIFGAPFNNFSGGGITLANLFRGWPKDKLACTATGHVLFGVSTDVCEVFYLLGKDEQKWKFPLNLLQRTFPSGLMKFEKKPNSTPPKYVLSNLRRTIVDKLFYPTLHWFGLFHSLSEIQFSDKFKSWVDTYKPEVLYLQVSSREEIHFATQLHEYLSVPTVIHMMDDWPSTISQQGLFHSYWRKKIDKEFRQLLNRLDLYLSISDAMSQEYKKRYNIDFKPFHNPIDVSKFHKADKPLRDNNQTYRILYLGRIGVANKNSIHSFANVISRIKSEKYKVAFDIYSTGIEYSDSRKIDRLPNVRIMAPVKYEKVPELLDEYDLLFLPLDFTRDGFRYAQYSIPTKASEYMMSGTPIIVFAPAATAISRFIRDNECGYCITENNEKSIGEAIEFIINNPEYRRQISNKAVSLAESLFDVKIVRNKFQELLIKITRSDV